MFERRRALLIHVRDVESVEPVGFGGVDGRRGFLSGRNGWGWRGTRMQIRCQRRRVKGEELRAQLNAEGEHAVGYLYCPRNVRRMATG